MKLLRSPMGYLYTLSVPYFAAIASITGIKFLGLHYTGFIWLAFFIIGLFLILFYRRPIKFHWGLWAIWFSYVWLSLLWGGIEGWRDLQDPLQMTTPLVVGIVSSISVTTEEQADRLATGFLHGLLITTAIFLFFWFGPGKETQAYESGYSVRPSAMTVVLIACLFLARGETRRVLGWVVWTISLSITFLTGSRMATFVILVIPVVFGFSKRVAARIVGTFAICLLAVAIYFSPIFQERFFPSNYQEDSIGLFGVTLSSSGRFKVWPEIWRSAKQHLVFGSGVNQYYRFATKARFNIRAFDKPLNDYLRIIFEFGFVGLILFLTATGRQMLYFKKVLTVDSSTSTRSFAKGAYMGFFAMLVLSLTENTVVYGVQFLHPLFAIAGAAYGIQKEHRSDDHSDRGSVVKTKDPI